MIHDAILKYPLDRSQAIKKHLEIAGRYFNVAAIHDLRVEIKRLRAFYNCVAEIYPGFDARGEYRKIRRIFRAAGYLRDIHIRQELAGNLNREAPLSIGEYFNFLKQKEVDSRRGFTRAHRKFDTHILDVSWNRVSEIIKFHDDHFIEERLYRCYLILLEKLVKSGAAPEFDEKDYHQMRILSKETRYCLEINQILHPEQTALKDINEGLRAMHQVLGAWHDNAMAADGLQAFLQHDAARPLADEDSYTRLYNELTRRKDNFSSSFRNRWIHFGELLKIHGYTFPV